MKNTAFEIITFIFAILGLCGSIIAIYWLRLISKEINLLPDNEENIEHYPHDEDEYEDEPPEK